MQEENQENVLTLSMKKKVIPQTFTAISEKFWFASLRISPRRKIGQCGEVILLYVQEVFKFGGKFSLWRTHTIVYI